jgi:hypothetical protein
MLEWSIIQTMNVRIVDDMSSWVTRPAERKASGKMLRPMECIIVPVKDAVEKR